MDENFKKQILELRNRSSEEAALWLMEKFPIDSPEYGRAISLIPHRTWKKSEQIRLARYYLRRLPFANRKIYEVFCTIMSLKIFLNVVREFLPLMRSDKELLLYHLEPVLKDKATSCSDNNLINIFLADLTNNNFH